MNTWSETWILDLWPKARQQLSQNFSYLSLWPLLSESRIKTSQQSSYWPHLRTHQCFNLKNTIYLKLLAAIFPELFGSCAWNSDLISSYFCSRICFSFGRIKWTLAWGNSAECFSIYSTAYSSASIRIKLYLWNSTFAPMYKSCKGIETYSKTLQTEKTKSQNRLLSGLAGLVRSNTRQKWQASVA